MRLSELPRHMQVKLLRVLQEGTFERVGAEKTISVDVRIISATNKDLRREMERRNFREDLYYRLSVVPIRIPPLRERRNDIPLLAFHFLKLAAEQGQKAARLSEEALSLMMDYGWPGNVRELQNAIHFALVKSRGRNIEAEHLPTRNPADDLHGFQAGAEAPAHARGRCIGHSRRPVETGPKRRSCSEWAAPLFTGSSKKNPAPTRRRWVIWTLEDIARMAD